MQINCSTNLANTTAGLSDIEIRSILEDMLAPCKTQLHKVLLLPPDFTRYHSNAGRITWHIWDILKDSCEVDIMPALGTHVPLTENEARIMFGDIPYSRFLVHNWRNDVVKIGTVPGEYVASVSEGIVNDPIDVEVSKRLLDPAYDLILSIGQVVPHEVVGMANRNKNIFVGCGGADMINSSHILGAFFGLERIMGRDHTPVRDVFDYAEEHFLGNVPLSYILTVTTGGNDGIKTHGLFIGRERMYFEQAVTLAQKMNLTFVDKPLQKCVVKLDETEFKSFWLGNKAVYRTRMAMADDGELIVLAPGIERFGEDPTIDALLRKYGYCGREKIIELVKSNQDLRDNLSAAAHLIHASSDGRFKITYCAPRMSRLEIENACFDWADYDQVIKKYDPVKLQEGYNTVDGEKIFYISNPALGLWTDKAKFTS